MTYINGEVEYGFWNEILGTCKAYSTVQFYVNVYISNIYISAVNDIYSTSLYMYKIQT